MKREIFRVVIVDDSPEDRDEVRRLLRLGSERVHQFVEVTTGAEAIEACLEGPYGPPDCCVLDYYLPDMNAPEVLAALRAEGETTVCPVLVITGGAPPSGPEVLRAGAQDYLEKSWLNPALLARAVDNAVERHRMAREVRLNQTALVESRERLRLALQSSDTGIWTWDIATDAVTWSPECYRIHDRIEGTFGGTGQALFALVHDDDRARVEATVRAAIAEREPYECEFRILRPSGDVAWVANRGRAAYDAEGRPLAVLGSITDISRRKRAEDAVHESARRKEEFLATVAHELRNPLAPLRTGLALLGRAAPGDDLSRLCGMMERQVGQLVRLVDDLLDVSRTSSGKVEVVLAPVDLRQAVEMALETSRPLIDAGKHALTLRLPEHPLPVNGDVARLAQVLGNLVNNAAKYTPAGGSIEVAAELCGGDVALRVTDNGYGIPREMLTQVFEIFTQVDDTRARAQGGLGIGLSLVRSLVAAHGGRVSAESAGSGQGSTFTVRLPLASSAGQSSDDAPPASRARSPLS